MSTGNGHPFRDGVGCVGGGAFRGAAMSDDIFQVLSASAVRRLQQDARLTDRAFDILFRWLQTDPRQVARMEAKGMLAECLLRQMEKEDARRRG